MSFEFRKFAVCLVVVTLHFMHNSRGEQFQILYIQIYVLYFLKYKIYGQNLEPNLLQVSNKIPGSNRFFLIAFLIKQNKNKHNNIKQACLIKEIKENTRN